MLDFVESYRTHAVLAMHLGVAVPRHAGACGGDPAPGGVRHTGPGALGLEGRVPRAWRGRVSYRVTLSALIDDAVSSLPVEALAPLGEVNVVLSLSPSSGSSFARPLAQGSGGPR